MPCCRAARTREASVVLVTVDGSSRRGKLVDAKAIADEAVARVAWLKHMVVVRRAGNRIAWTEGRDHWWHELCANQPDDAPTEKWTPTRRTCWYSPPARLETQRRGARAYRIHGEDRDGPVAVHGSARDDRLLWMTDMGWVVGTADRSRHADRGCDPRSRRGSPNFPDPDRMWHLAAEHRVSYLGIAPTTARTVHRPRQQALESARPSALRIMVSSGEPDAGRMAVVVRENVGKSRVPLFNFLGRHGDDGHSRLLSVAAAQAVQFQYSGAGHGRRHLRRVGAARAAGNRWRTS